MQTKVNPEETGCMWKLVYYAMMFVQLFVKGPLYRDLMGRLAALLHIVLQLACFIIIVYRITTDAMWWRSNALSDSYKVCRADSVNTETTQLCEQFHADLQSLLNAFATAVAAETLKMCTAVGALVCSRSIASSTRLDHGSWFTDKHLRRMVGRFRDNKAGRLSFSKPCQWRAAVLACSVWGLCLICDLIVSGVIGWYALAFKSQISEYSEELFPEASDEYSWGSVILTVTTLGVAILLDSLMLAAAVVLVHGLSKISNEWTDDDDSDDAHDNIVVKLNSSTDVQ